MPLSASSAQLPTPRTVLTLHPPIYLRQECIEHKLLVPYPVTFSKGGGFVARVKFTAIVTENGAVRITGHPPPFVHSKYQCVAAPARAPLLS